MCTFIVAYLLVGAAQQPTCQRVEAADVAAVCPARRAHHGALTRGPIAKALLGDAAEPTLSCGRSPCVWRHLRVPDLDVVAGPGGVTARPGSGIATSAGKMSKSYAALPGSGAANAHGAREIKYLSDSPDRRSMAYGLLSFRPMRTVSRCPVEGS
jgi:hypothetical protein